MAGKLIMWAVSFGCGILFFAIGVYARNREKPMWFWSGSEVCASQISDVKQYNRENGVMWKLYSLWYFAAGTAAIWNAVLALVFLVSGCTAGMVLLVASYHRIFNKYRVP
ncbi:MAG: hypothetical protein IJ507_10145 [Clostridia bacterium]|nr:hypothetical protein [Clostridia bacterium]